MEITGRITADAKVYKLADGRQVTNFTLVINDHYKTKTGERKEVATFFNCAYWLTPKAAQYLKRGTIISVFGRIGLDVYKNMSGEPQGALTFHVNQFRFITGIPKPAGAATGTPATSTQTVTPNNETKDDLPF